MGLFSTVPGCTRLYLALHRSAMIYLTIDCHRLPLTGLNASVYTGLNVQKLKVGWMGWDLGRNLWKHLFHEHLSAVLIIQGGLRGEYRMGFVSLQKYNRICLIYLSFLIYDDNASSVFSIYNWQWQPWGSHRIFRGNKEISCKTVWERERLRLIMYCLSVTCPQRTDIYMLWIS